MEPDLTGSSLFDKKILLVDDEKDITNLLEEVLRRDGFKNILKAAGGQEAVNLCKSHRPDVIILDIMLPDLDGIEVCKMIRGFSYSPILFLSSKNDDIDKILGLSSGGDDYVTKPFSPREVVYRVKAQLRRQQYNSTENFAKPDKIRIGKLEIDMDGRRAYKDGREIELTAREFGLLCYLAENPNKIISKERLYEQVWGEDSVGCDNTIMVHIRHIREKLEDDPTSPKLLQTVKGLGYRLVKRDD
jgi:Response regulators consisting of a CheY-like receiver domain and a winged-helix DNA-binding domain